ncbi:MAG: hypothetical protein M1834_003135 [Cirrosporium novae-zelandiae]|nr:MAG: hypothetical protein M1834_003135 [Cirrosporium novae-zelandiae]
MSSQLKPLTLPERTGIARPYSYSVAMSSSPSKWQKAKHSSKASFDKVWKLMDKAGAPVNNLSNKLGSEAFWPMTMDKECDKAARILRSFCKDGFYESVDQGKADEIERTREKLEGPKGKQRVIKKIPQKVIQNAKGLAIFTTMRTGLWVSGAGGSGVLVARLPDGSWSPPSGILLHTAGIGFLVGVDIYDCVIVINTEKALEAFTKTARCTLGGELSAVAGPVGIGGILESEVHKRQAPIWTYLKSRGFYAGVQIDGTVLIERGDENERFYGQRIPSADILAGKANHPPLSIRTLMQTIKAAQGDSDVDESVIPAGESTADMDVDWQTEANLQIEEEPEELPFSVPAEDDPDPYGVLALESAGIEIHEAGTEKRPSLEVFQFSPAPSSPLWRTSFARRSMDVDARRRSSWRKSTASLRSMYSDRGTQTAVDEEVQQGLKDLNPSYSPITHSPSAYTPSVPEEEEYDHNGIHPDEAEGEKSKNKTDNNEDDNKDNSRQQPRLTITPPLPSREFDKEHEEVHEPTTIQAAQASPSRLFQAKLVTIPKRPTPALPPRNPSRKKLVVNAEPIMDTSNEDTDQEDSERDHDADNEAEPRSSGEEHRSSTTTKASSVSFRRSSSSSTDESLTREQSHFVDEEKEYWVEGRDRSGSGLEQVWGNPFDGVREKGNEEVQHVPGSFT